MGIDRAGALDDVSRRSLASSTGERYLDFRKQLPARWGVVWSQLFAGHLVLAGVLCVLAIWGPGWSWSSIPVGVGAGVVLGYTLHYIVLFQHEGAHFNLAPSRHANDLLTDAAVGVLIGEPIAAYRTVHLDHHRYLGTVHDTERSYFEAPNLRFVVEGLTGVRLLRTLALRARVRSGGGGAVGDVGSGAVGDRVGGTPKRRLSAALVGAATLNGSLVVLALVFGRPAIAGGWLLGLVVVLPFLISLRQVLEHRSFDARADVDYAQVPHGATNRLFGDGPLASTLGAAGFNRHLLHHWDPGVSYTRLADLENFLLDTIAREPVVRARSTYLATLRRLVRP